MAKLRKARPYLLGGAFTLVFVAAFFLFMLPQHVGEYYGQDWDIHYETHNGTEYRIEEKQLLPSDTSKYFRVVTTRQYLNVYLDGEVIYSYQGGQNGRPVRGMYPIEIPAEYAGKTLRLEMSSPYPHDNHMMGSQFSVAGYGLHFAVPDFVFAVIALVIGVSIAVVAVMLVVARLAKLIVWMLAAAVLFFASFALSTTLPAMLLMNPHVLYYTYMAGFLFYPICMYVYLYISYTETLKKALLPFLLLPILFAAASLVLDMAGVMAVNRFSFWYGYICFLSLAVMLIGAAFSRRTTGLVSGVVLAIICVWLAWGLAILLRQYVFHVAFSFNSEYIWVYTVVCAIEVGHNIVLFTKQLMGLRYRDLYLTEKNRHLARYYESIEQHFHEIALLKHEMNHHLVTLGYLHRNRAFNEAEAYLENIGTAYRVADRARLSENHILNAVLGYLQAEAARRSINVEVACHVPAQLPMREEDLSSLLLNLAENALESCARLEDAGSRHIRLTARYENHLLFVGMENSMAEAWQKDGRFLSAKRDHAQPGLGLEVVEKVVKRYDGTMDVTAANGWFTIKLLLNLPVLPQGITECREE